MPMNKDFESYEFIVYFKKRLTSLFKTEKKEPQVPTAADSKLISRKTADVIFHNKMIMIIIQFLI